MKQERGQYKEIPLASLSKKTKAEVLNLFEEAKNSKKVDEHSNWEFNAEFDNKGRGYAINWDLYGIGKDYFSKKTMIIIQIRKWEKHYRNGFANVRKSYFLIGRNEDNSTFAHSVSANVIHRAIRNGVSVIQAVQNWIFGCEYTKIVRQGDIAFLPLQKKPGKCIKYGKKVAIIEKSHRVEAEQILKNGDLYALNPTMFHLPGTHPIINAEGWVKIVVGNRARFHNFAAPTID